MDNAGIEEWTQLSGSLDLLTGWFTGDIFAIPSALIFIPLPRLKTPRAAPTTG